MMNSPGHNQPPSHIEFSKETVTALSDWMKEHPIIDTEETAREAKLLIDRATACTKDMDAERDGKVRPLNEQVKAINDQYREPANVLTRVYVELQARLGAFLVREEEKRKAIAEEARRKANEEYRLLRQAEAEEVDRKLQAKQGVLDVDIGSATAEADEAFSRFTKAAQKAALAAKETHVKIGGGFRRAASLRTKETLTITDIHAAINDVGGSELVVDAIITAARSYRTIFGHLPDGIKSDKDRSL